MKKIIITFLILALNCMSILPSLCADFEQPVAHKVGNMEVIDANTEINLEFAQDFNIKNAYVDQIVDFKLADPITDNGNVVIPAGSTFSGVITNKEDSRWAFRKARASIVINKLTMPDGTQISIMSEPKKGELSAPTALNVTKAVATSAVAAAVCFVGATIIAVECLSIGGLLFAPETGIAMGVALGVTSKGLNYKAKAGDKITIKLDRELDVNFYNPAQ